MRRAVAALSLASSLILTASATRAEPQGTPVLAPALQIARGDVALRAGDSISALSLYREAVQRAPRDARGYVALGNGYLAVGEARNALEVFEAGARNARGSEALALGLARCYALLGKGDQALQVLRKLAQESHASVALFEALAEQAEASGALIEALAARRAVLSLLRTSDDASDEQRKLARTRVAALALLVGKADRVGSARCGEPNGPLLDTLLACPARP